jgi:type I restriction enzyme S subunit
MDEADELRKLRAQADLRTAALIPSLSHKMFGDPILNPKGCKVVRLEEVTARITDGVHLKPNYTTSGVPFISVKNITTGKLKFDDCKFISAEDHAKFTKRCKAEYLDILYTKVGATYGRPALVDTEAEFSIYVSVCLIKPNKSIIDPHFLEIALGTPAIKHQADRSIKGIGVPDLHLDQIRKFLLPLPPLAQQKEFARRVSEIRVMQTEQATSRQRLDDLFQSMLHRAFNGKL